MKTFSAFAVAALLGTSIALAQGATPPGSTGTEAAPPPSASQSPGTSSATTSESTGATSGKHMSYKACSKQAHSKHLKGSERKQFIKDCEEGKDAG
jgi:hypothetical protein